MKHAKHGATDAVAVYCRVRPIEDDEDCCLSVKNEQQVLLREPEQHAVAKGNSAVKESTYNFSYVFDQDVTQREIFDDIAYNLITSLLRGKSSILMTYGVTSSGKTYTMNGKPSDIGILPRSIDVLFNSVGNYLAHKCVFKPDKLNGFDVQSEADAIIERHRNMEKGLRGDGGSKVPSAVRSGKQEYRHRVSDVRKIPEVDDDNVYAIFVSYIEIYNNYVFDLLDDGFENSITGERKSKNIREDLNRVMYVQGANEVEVDSVDEAFFWLNKGQHRRRFADTALNRESSRSHSIFKIRVVQAPVEKDNEPINDRNCLLVSQLCLVDLAGSERLVRTKATGNRLVEAKNINSSLMVLKNCIDALRENQKDKNCTRIVPYRDSKLTHLFRSYFEGNGLVRMICCVNPHANEYDENLHVLNFAESCREVEIPCIEDNKREKLKKRANKIFESSMHKLSGTGASDAKRRCNWSFPNFPFDELPDPKDDRFFSVLTEHLSEVEALRTQYWSYYESGYSECIDLLNQGIVENAATSSSIKEYEEKLAAKSKQVANLENRIRSLEKKLQRSEAEVRDMKIELSEKESAFDKEISNSSRAVREMRNKLKFEREMYQKDLAKQLNECNASWQIKWEMQNAKWKNIQEMINKNGEMFSCEQMNDLFTVPEPIVLDPKTPVPSASGSGSAPMSARTRRPTSVCEADVNNIASDNIQTEELVIASKTPAASSKGAGSTGTSAATSSSKPFRVKQRRSRSAQRWVSFLKCNLSN